MNSIQRFFITLFFIFPLVVYGQVSFGEPEKINDNWRFTLNDEQRMSSLVFDDSEWQMVNLPHDWSVKGQLSPSLAACTGYLPGGTGWYRKSFTVPESKKEEKVYLYFEGVYNRSEVFVNGHSLGKRPNGYISFMYDATPFVTFGGENTVAVRVDHSQSADSRWYTGSGIYRNVWLVYAHPVHIGQWGVYAYPSVADYKQGTLSIEVEVDNESSAATNLTVRNELFDTNGKSVAQNNKKRTIAAKQKGNIQTTLHVKNPALWDLNAPNLYTLKTTLLQDGKAIDSSITTTGFRTFTFSPDKGFALNGNWMKIKGVCIHHDAGVLGSAVSREIWKRRLLTLKEIGCNAIRTSHNPQAPDLYRLCDELGLLVLNEAFDEWEFPKRKWIEGWNVGTPGFQGTFDFFEEWGEKDLADMIRRDRNHPAVFAWSIGNEVDYPNDPYSHPVLDGGKETGFTQAMFGGYKKEAPDAMRLGGIAKRLAAVAKQYDKSRPVTAGLAGVAMSNETEYPGALDIVGYNYTESMYDSDHKKYPNRIIYGSENRHDPDAWKAVRDKEHIFGQFLWTGIDYLGESGRWPARGSNAGLLDFGGFIKPRGYFRQSLWSDKPMVYIGTYPVKANSRLSQDAWPVWNYQEGEMIRIVCYTNAAKARLELNGKNVGEEKEYDDNTGIIYWDIPYQNGKLEVTGLNENGNEAGRYKLESSRQPYAISIVSADNRIDKDKGVAQVILQVVDEEGIPVMLSDNEVACHIEGAAQLLGLETGNNTDMTDYTDNRHRVYHGRMIAYIRANGTKGVANVTFTSPWLKEATVRIEISEAK
jgi:beta-galactosidase/beta-glucuronidase